MVLIAEVRIVMTVMIVMFILIVQVIVRAILNLTLIVIVVNKMV